MRTLARPLALLCSFWLLLAAVATAQESTPSSAPSPPATSEQEPQDPPPQGALEDTAREALERLAAALRERRGELAKAKAAKDTELIETLEQDIEELRFQFAGLAAHLDVKAFIKPEKKKFDAQEELQQLLRPILSAIKDATAGPRMVADLEEQLADLTERKIIAQRAADSVIRTRDALAEGSEARAEAEREYTEQWRPMLDELTRKKLVIEANLQRLQDDQKGLVSNVTDKAHGFLKNSGLNLLLCIVVFLVTFFSLSLLSRLVLRGKRERGFSVRLTEVLLRVLTVIIAIVATLMVPYTRNDLLLLAIGLVFLLGAGWVIVKMAPQFFEQIRMILNIGPVREGERLLVDGLPYRVEALRFNSVLINPDLSGGRLRVPVKDLIGQRSRPPGHDEPWFPCKEGDVVALADDTIGQILLQTPEVVVIAERHDAPSSYPTLAFLEQNPRNLSNGFEITISFGVDYNLQADVATKVPHALQQAVAAGFDDLLEEQELREVRVELESAGESSLNFAVLIELEGSAAVQYHELHRRANALLVAACTEHGFGIPFPQMTIHKA